MYFESQNDKTRLFEIFLYSHSGIMAFVRIDEPTLDAFIYYTALLVMKTLFM